MLSWSDLLKDSIVKIEDLDKVLHISPEEKEAIKTVVKRHPMRLTRYYYDLIDWSDPNDPIRKLSVPDQYELDTSGDYDTSGESANTIMPGLQHKYKQTALVMSTNVCFMYCRHCFRKRMVGYSKEEINKRMTESNEYIKNHKEINNVLITGGDAFTLSNNVIERYLKHFSSMAHLDFIRFGTRIPVVFPHRIFMDDELLDILKRYNNKKEIIVVTQFDHPNELTEEARKGVKALKNIGITVRNQTVLLKGINDNADTLSKLLKGLTSIGVQPYYVFQCRPVKYVKEHFQVPLFSGMEIIKETRKKLDGVSKAFRYAMSHPQGKIEIFGKTETDMIFKFHQAKSDENSDLIFMKPINKNATWLDGDLNLI
jgi:lysine 2,3-aminomutase